MVPPKNPHYTVCLLRTVPLGLHNYLHFWRLGYSVLLRWTTTVATCSQHAFTLLTQYYPKHTKLPKIDLDLFFKTHTWLGVIDSNYYSRNQNPVSYLWTNTQYLTDNYILISQQYFFNRNIFLIKKARFLWLLKCIIIYFIIDILSFF